MGEAARIANLAFQTSDDMLRQHITGDPDFRPQPPDLRLQSTAHLCVVTAAEIEFRAVAGLLLRKVKSQKGLLSQSLGANAPGLLGGTENPARRKRALPGFHSFWAPRERPEESLSEEGIKLCRGQWDGAQVTVLQSGIGAPGFSQRLAAHLAATHYDALLVVGLAGGLDPKLKTGDAIIYDCCFKAQAEDRGVNSREKPTPREENVSIACDAGLAEQIAEVLRDGGLPCARGAGVTVGCAITEAESKLELGQRYGAVAVDMETYQVLATCAQFGLPAAALRVVADEAGSKLPDFNRGLKADGGINHWRILSALLARPANSVRFFHDLKRAMRALKRATSSALSVKLQHRKPLAEEKRGAKATLGSGGSS